ncbi:MAG: VWA domain-containing protein [Candidatus Eisenbacteria bacterium]|nr:VWA domain-containing protein [Candidatus Eisenbacteria bacterium]
MTPIAPEVSAVAQTGGTLVAVDGKAYPLESAAVMARAEGGFATSTLTQVYANPHDEPLEVQYTLPLPADGAVLGYTITIGERVIRARVEPREKADRQYKQALYEGRTAGLLEQSRPDTFQQRLGNVPPRTKVSIAIDVLHPLAFVPGDSGGAPVWEYRFPTVVGVRYFGGRTPDAAELSPDRGAEGVPVEMSFTLRVGDEQGASARCSTHRAVVSRGVDGAAMLAFERGEALDRDIVARWDACAAEIGVRVAEGGGLEGDDGRYALVTVVPPAAPVRVWSRDVTLLLDTSGSMSGLPLDLAKRVASDLLRSLGEGDCFEVMEFSSEPRQLTKGAVAWSETSLASALAAIGALEAGGCTEMGTAVCAALGRVNESAQRQIVLVTDGDIGFESDVVAQATGAHNVRLHVVGVGSAPNRSLTQQVAAAGRGTEVLVETVAQAFEGARRLVAATAKPVLTGVTVSGTALAGLEPGALGDVFAGQPLVFTVELSHAGGSLEVSGDLAGGGGKWLHRIAVPARSKAALELSPLPLGALFGRQRIAELERGPVGEHSWTGSRRESRRASEIERLGLRHQIASSRTSLIAISVEPTVDPKQPRRVERLAVEVPYGVSAEGAGIEPAEATWLSASASRDVVRDSIVGLFKRRASSMDPPVHMALRKSPGRPHGTNVRWASRTRLAFDFVLDHNLIDPACRVGTLHGSGGEVTSVQVEIESPAGPMEEGLTVRVWLTVPKDFAGEPGESWRFCSGQTTVLLLLLTNRPMANE